MSMATTGMRSCIDAQRLFIPDETPVSRDCAKSAPETRARQRARVRRSAMQPLRISALYLLLLLLRFCPVQEIAIPAYEQ
jgi:hypothetical protein